MALNNVWEDKQDGIDDILSKDINGIAHAVIEGEKGIEELKERVDGINVALQEKANTKMLKNTDISQISESGIYQISSGCSGLPDDLYDSTVAQFGCTLIVSEGEAGNGYSQYLIYNHENIESTVKIADTRIYACYIYNPSGTPSYDMPWTLIYDTSKPQLTLDNTLTKEGAAADSKAVGDALAELEGATVARYGVKFGGSANTGATVQRLYNAFGLVANVGTDTETAVNDFDNIYPWSGRKRCCGYFDENGNFVVNAYENEPGYTTDGTNGEVWVETPLFYYKHTYNDDGSEEVVISAHPIGGFQPSPIHINPDGSLRQKAYTAAYPMAVVDNKPTSRSGVYTPIMSLNSGMINARLMGEKYTTTTTAEQYVKCLLMWVEFATRDVQTKMKGCSSLSYSADHKATVAEEAANRIIISKNYASAYVVGQGIAIGTALGSTNVANNRTVTAIADYDDTNTAISFDGDPVNIAVGNIVFAIAWKTGSCDNVLTSSGSPVSNTSGKYTCIYRGEETPFGNAFEWISDVLFKREGSGTTEDPYSYDIYFLKDPTQYSNGTITDNYTKLNFKLPTADGYVKKLGFDSRFPWLRIPCEIGSSSTTYYADYYTYPRYALCAAGVGGSWSLGGSCGPCCWNCNNAPSDANVNRRARLSYRR